MQPISANSDNFSLPSGKQHPTIGIILPDLNIPYVSYIWYGALAAAQTCQANVLCIRGDRRSIAFDPSRPYDPARYYHLYHLINERCLDGIILVGIGLFHNSDEEASLFCNFYRPLPIVTLGRPVAGVHRVLVANAEGIAGLVRHFVEQHGYRRIAFIQGPAHNQEAQLRYEAYVATLAEYGLPLDPQLVVPGEFVESSGIAGMATLLDERQLKPHQDLEAVIGANDAVALGALKALQQRGIRVPKEIAVAGFDDIEDGRISSPPLTTVRQPHYTLGQTAFDVIWRLVHGEEVTEETLLPTTLVVRRSCGCYPQLMQQAEAITLSSPSSGYAPDTPLDVALTAQHDRYLEELTRTVGLRNQDRIRHWGARLLEALLMEITETGQGVFLETLQEGLWATEREHDDIEAWHAMVSILKRSVTPYLADRNLRIRAENLWQQARILVTTMAQRIQAYEIQRQARLTLRLNDSGHDLMSARNREELLDRLANRLPAFHIPGGYVVCYENPDEPAGVARLIMAYNDAGRIALPSEGQRFSASQLLPEGLLAPTRSHALMMSSLHFQDERLGFLVFELGPMEGRVYETLAMQLSSALKAEQLLQTQVRAQEILGLQPLIEQLSGGAVQLVQASDQLTHISGRMASGAEQTLQQASNVSSQTHEIGHVVKEISVAVAEEASSIREISHSITNVTEIITRAVEIADSANATMHGLETHSQQIGNVLKAITDIAEQTELLALNATIKAAQAGDVGRGFAVIANHVKDLAYEVTRSTEDIEQKITLVQKNSQQSVTAITQVMEIIRQVSGLFDTIVTASSRQTETTHAIVRTITDMIHANDEIAGGMNEFVAAARSSSEQATHVQQEAHELEGLSAQLRQLVEQVNRIMSASTSAG